MMAPRSAWLGLVLLTAACAQSQVIIDGEFGDWAGVLPLSEDDVDGGLLDLRAASIRHDASSVYLRLALEKPVNLQVLPEGTIRLLLDADRDAATGQDWAGVPGTDWAIDFSPARTDGKEPQRYGARFLFANPDGSTTERSIHAVDLAVSPTISSRWFEMRVPRIPAWFPSSEGFNLSVVATDSKGRVLDQLPAIVYRFDQHPAAIQPARSPPRLERSEADTLRVLTWNVADEYLELRFDRFKKVVALLQPDVLMLDEAPRDVTETRLRELVSGIPGSDNWAIHVGHGGGRQRCAVISRYPLTPLAAFNPLPYEREVVRATRASATPRMTKDARTMHRDGMPVAGVAVQWQDRTLFAVVADLQCCGRDASPEDVFRGIQMAMLRRTLDAAVALSPPDALIIGGDFNLVGSRLPLDIALAGGDLDQSDLRAVPALQPDGISNATFGFDGPFPPGRLDYLVYSDSSLQPVNSFVFDSRDVDPAWLAGNGLDTDSSRHTSDHMPIVVDFRWVND